MPEGRFKGQAIDMRSRRSVEIIAENDDYFIVDYFYHRGRYFSARLPKDGVNEIQGQRFNFSNSSLYNPLVNHAQVRFTMDPDKPIQLYPLGTGEYDSPTFIIHNFSYSVEVVGPRRATWSLRTAFGDFISAHRLLSIEEVIYERIILGKYKVIQSPPLQLNQQQRNAALEMVLRRCDAAGMSERYYLFKLRCFGIGAANCTSEIFSLLDSLLYHQYTLFQRTIAKSLYRLPFALRRYLIFRAVIDKNMQAPTLNDEFSDLIRNYKLKIRLKKQIEKPNNR